MPSVPPAQALSERGLMPNIAWYRRVPEFGGRQAGGANRRRAARRRGCGDSVGTAGGVFRQAGTRTHGGYSGCAASCCRNVPFAFDISMGVRPGDDKLAAQLNSIIERRAAQVRAILARSGVPLLDRGR